MRHQMKTILIAVLAGSTAIAIQAANDDPSASSSSSLNAGRSSQIQQSSSTSQSGQKLLLDQLPKRVQKTMLQHSGGSNPENIHQITENGKQFYTATFDRANEKGRMTVARDGSLVSLQESAEFAADIELPKLPKSQMGFKQLPQPVQQTIQQQAGASNVRNVSLSKVDGKQYYRADFNREGIRHELFIKPDGKIAAQVQETAFAFQPMENVHSLALKDAPKDVQQAARNNAQGGKVSDIDKAKWKGQTVYSVMVDKNGQLSQWIYDKNGKVVAQPGQTVNEAAGADNSSFRNQSGQQQSQSSSTENQNSNQQQSPK